MNNIIYNSNNVLNEIFKGISAVFNIINVTYGPQGKNVLIKLPGKLMIIDDGVTVVNNIKSNDESFSIGINVCQSISNSINDICGDGTTTGIILFYHLFKNCLEQINNGKKTKVIINDLKITLDNILSKVDNFSNDIKPSDLDKVLISSTLDKQIISNLKNAFEIVNTNGLIFLRKTSMNEYIKHIKGYFFYIKNIYEIIDLNNYKVVLVNDYINDFSLLMNLKDSKYLVICRDINESIYKHFKSSNIFIVQLKEKDSDIIFKDLEKLLNISCSYQTVNISNEINVTVNNDCLFFNGLESSELKSIIEAEMNSTNSIVKINRLRERYAKLTSGIVNIYINGFTEEEIENKVLMYEDALKSGYNALKYGVCKGAGYIYYLLVKEINNDDNILYKSLKSLILSLINNTNNNTEYIYNQLSENTWYDLLNDTFIEVDKLNVYDSVYNIKHILKIVISNICLLINTNGIVYNNQIQKDIINEFL